MGPYGTIHPGVNGTHCKNQYPQMEPSNITCLWGITAFSKLKQQQCNLQFIANHLDLINRILQHSAMQSNDITINNHVHA